MRKSLFVAALLLTTTLSAAAFATTVTHDRTKIVGHSAYATWTRTDGDLLTFVNVIVTQNDDTTDGVSSPDAFVALAIDQAEMSTGNVLIAGEAYVIGPENFSFTIDKALGTATLHVRNAIFEDDNSFTFFNVDMDLTWTATADAVTQRSHDNFNVKGFHEESVFQGATRDAVATGSITGKNMQFTPVPSSVAQLLSNKFGDVTVTITTP